MFKGCCLFILLLSQHSYAQSLSLSEDPDIASYRTKFNVNKPNEAKTEITTYNSKKYTKPQLDITQKLNQKLDSIYIKNKQIKFAQGYRVLVFSGTDKKEMNLVKQKVYQLFPDVEVYTIFKQPEYRILFGDFIDKIHAYNYLVKIQNTLPNALIVQDKINIQVNNK